MRLCYNGIEETYLFELGEILGGVGLEEFFAEPFNIVGEAGLEGKHFAGAMESLNADCNGILQQTFLRPLCSCLRGEWP